MIGIGVDFIIVDQFPTICAFPLFPTMSLSYNKILLI